MTARHGTDSCYVNHGCRCDPCRAAHAAYIARWRARARTRDPAALNHGEPSTYTNYACRCQECWEAHRALRAAQRLPPAARKTT